jgi:hypothetical protein
MPLRYPQLPAEPARSHCQIHHSFPPPHPIPKSVSPYFPTSLFHYFPTFLLHYFTVVYFFSDVVTRTRVRARNVS